MREFKFRAWEKSLNEIIPVDNIDFKRQMVNTDGAWRLFKEIELMQYTGLKDVNGLEVYEGDVLEHGYVVTYVDGSKGDDFGMEIGFYTQRGNFESWSKIVFGEGLEVLGNIYENPELI